MGRSRAKMQMIESKKVRNTTFQKRYECLKKKANELSTLCDVKLCLITFLPMENDNGATDEPVRVWPENQQEIHSLIESYKKSRADDDSKSKVYDPCFYLKDRITKVDGDLAKLRQKYVQIKYPTWNQMYEVQSPEDLRKLADFLKVKLKATRNFMRTITNQTFPAETSHNAMMNSNSSYHDMIQNRCLYERTTTDRMEFGLPQQQPGCFSHSNVQGYQNSNSFIPMEIPQWIPQQHAIFNQYPPLLMETNSVCRSDNMVFYDAFPALFDPIQNVGVTGDNRVETEAMQKPPVPDSLRHLPSGAPMEMTAPKTNEPVRGHFQISSHNKYVR